ncbi:hypothetical protein [Endozoicomonas numazuensis]|uniref:Uncharacterized protein n=1 Tax=Endozoicomonas numazuensis TaxID=1137799 RepID=A0A081NL27_9GAMM|nr:hypothetical protein [Endozoicomonas numazuensis]KEQ19150.1 hypothetical protein GZ78_03875 [Endozoicomonas numazuensis]
MNSLGQKVFVTVLIVLTIRLVAADDQIEICISRQQLNTNIIQQQQNPIQAEQVAVFLGQQAANHVIPVLIHGTNMPNNQRTNYLGKIFVGTVLVASTIIILVGVGPLVWGAVDIGDGLEEKDDTGLITIGSSGLIIGILGITGSVIYLICKCR